MITPLRFVHAVLSVSTALMLVGCGNPNDPSSTEDGGDSADLVSVAADASTGPGEDGGASNDGGGNGCTDPVTGQPLAAGATVQTYALSVATTQAECDAARVTSTCSANGQLLPPTASSPTCTVEALPPPGTAYYFSDCQAGASSGCVPGDNVNDGRTPATAKRTLDGFNVDTLPAGTFVMFARGGVWNDFHVQIVNLNATPEQPITFGSYAPSWGGTARPWLKSHTVTAAFELGRYMEMENDGGYTLRNLKLDGDGGQGAWGIWLRAVVRYVTAENLEITGFQIGIHSQSEGDVGVNHFTLRSSNIHHNTDMGMLGDGIDMLIENNVFHLNNATGSGFSHAIYLGGHGQRATVRGNVFTQNSTVNGVCMGGNFTMHGQWDGLLFENNLLSQQDSEGGCYGVSLNPGYATAEYMRHVVVRGNTIVNLGNCGVCASSVPGIVIENNVIVHGTPRYHGAITLGGEPGPGDDTDDMGIIRNNTIYYTQASQGVGVDVRAAAGNGVQVVSNLVYYAAAVGENTLCYAHPDLGHFAAFDYNLCFKAGGTLAPWSVTYGTLAAAQAAGFDAHGLTSDPAFTAMPTGDNAYSCALAATSGAVDHGHPTLSSALGYGSVPRTVPDVGACER